jgi:integrase
MARKRGSRNRGYWFRKGRGWYVGSEPLTNPQGQRITDPDARQEAEAAYHLHMVGKGEGNGGPQTKPESGYTAKDVCYLYLKDASKSAAKSTYDLRKRLLEDFCEGYGSLPVGKLIGLHVKEWLDSHPGWKGSRRMAVQAIRRAIFYCKGLGVLTGNPIAGFKAGAPGKRQAYFSEQQEAAIYEHAPKALAELVRVLIRTGARPGEAARLEFRHVEETPAGQLWRFPPTEHKTGHQTGADRVIPVPSDIAELVRSKRRYSHGRVFRNKNGNPWTATGMKSSFRNRSRNLGNWYCALGG